MDLKIQTGSLFLCFVISVSSPLPKVNEHTVGIPLNETTEYRKPYEIKLEHLSEGFVPEEFLANWLTNYILNSFGVGLNDNETYVSAENSTLEELLDENQLRYKSLINMESAFGPCPKGRRRDKQGNCRKQFSG